MSTGHGHRPLGDATISGAQLVEVSDGVYAYIQPDGTWWINNAGFIVGDRSIVSIDGCATERRTRAYLERIASVSPLPVTVLVNTHHHGDHTFGNHLFRDATIVGHEACREGILDWGEPRSAPYWTHVEWGDIELRPPTLTYRDEITLHVGDLRCEVRYVGGPAHTTNDSIVWIPERSVLFSGDLLFHGGTPFLVQGSIEGCLRTLEGVLAPLDATTIVPGHGPVATPQLIANVADYLRFVRQVAVVGRRTGRTPLEQARETDLGRFATLTDAERLVGNLHRAYAELDGAPPGARIDVAAALADMVALNGGQPLSCHV